MASARACAAPRGAPLQRARRWRVHSVGGPPHTPSALGDPRGHGPGGVVAAAGAMTGRAPWRRQRGESDEQTTGSGVWRMEGNGGGEGGVSEAHAHQPWAVGAVRHAATGVRAAARPHRAPHRPYTLARVGSHKPRMGLAPHSTGVRPKPPVKGARRRRADSASCSVSGDWLLTSSYRDQEHAFPAAGGEGRPRRGARREGNAAARPRGARTSVLSGRYGRSC